MYRISFDVNSSRWVIQLQRLGFLWSPIREMGKTQSWPDYDAAAAYVEKVGLDKVYRNYQGSALAAIWQGEAHQSGIWQGNYSDPAVIRRRAS